MDEAVFIDRVLFPVTALGPGKRIAIWVSGCHRRCLRCANPELWAQREEQKIADHRLSAILSSLIKDKAPDGITISGGEPFDQAAGLSAVLQSIPALKNLDVLIYSGYTLEQLLADRQRAVLLPYASVLIDGPYIEEQNDPSVVLRGSSNQRIHFMDPSAEAVYQEYMKAGRQIQNYVYDYEILSVGIHNRSRHLENS
mgnify:FL=1